MNATPPISQAPPSPNPIRAAAPAASDSTDRSNSQDFAGAMSTAGGKPARKPAAKQHDSAPGGSALPVAGNQAPPNAAPTAGASPAGQTGAAVGANSATGAAAAVSTAGSPASGSPAAGSPTAPSDASVAAAPAAQAPVATPPTSSAAAAELAAADILAAADLQSMPPAASIQTSPTAAPAQGAPPVAAPGLAATAGSAAALPATKATDSGSSKAEIAAATSAPTSTNNDAAQNTQAQASVPSTADTDAAAQAAMAAALAQGTSALPPDSSASSDDLATPDIGVTLPGVAAANEVAAPLPGGLAVHAAAAATSASVTAATAAAVVQAASATADSGATGKHPRDNGPDASLGAAQLLTSNAASDTATGPAPTFKVSAGVDTADFGQGVADRVSLMMDGNLTSAKLQVNPPALGPIEVRIALQGGHAQVWMSSHSAVTRDALESSSPKLREMLGAQGFSQVSVDISQRSFQDRTPPQPQAYESVSAFGSGSAPPAQASLATVRSANGLLDAYA